MTGRISRSVICYQYVVSCIPDMSAPMHGEYSSDTVSDFVIHGYFLSFVHLVLFIILSYCFTF